MNELNLDAESVTRNKAYDAIDHLRHLLKIGWLPDSQLMKKFLVENNLSTTDLEEAIKHTNELSSKECCTERN